MKISKFKPHTGTVNILSTRDDDNGLSINAVCTWRSRWTAKVLEALQVIIRVETGL